MTLTKFADRKVELPSEWPSLTWPSWRWLDDMFRDIDGRQMIKVEEFSEGDAFIVRAEIPGIDAEKDLNIEVLDGTLMLRAQKSETKETNERHLHRSEFRYGSFVRNIAIPKGVDESMIVATYVDGVLEVRVPMPSGASLGIAHRIPISTR